MKKICVNSWCDNFLIRDLKKGELNNYNVCSTDIEEIFTDLEEATEFYDNIEQEISFNNYDVYVRSKTMYYIDEDNNRIDDINILEDFDMGLNEFIENL